MDFTTLTAPLPNLVLRTVVPPPPPQARLERQIATYSIFITPLISATFYNLPALDTKCLYFRNRDNIKTHLTVFIIDEMDLVAKALKIVLEPKGQFGVSDFCKDLSTAPFGERVELVEGIYVVLSEEKLLN